MLDKIALFTVKGIGFPDVKVLRPTPIGDDPWGQLAPLQGTPWGDEIAKVSGEVLSNALHGESKMLMQEIGPPPHALLKKIPKGFRVCNEIRDCIMADGKICHPCPAMPECYSPPALGVDAKFAACVVALAWKEDRYVIVVEGEEFSL